LGQCRSQSGGGRVKNEGVARCINSLRRFAAVSLLRAMLLVIAASQRERAREFRYLKIENETLRSELPGRIAIATKKRHRLVKFGSKFGNSLH
jgi:hypothetical protein